MKQKQFVYVVLTVRGGDVVSIAGKPDLQVVLNDFGSKGWQVVGTPAMVGADELIYFKVILCRIKK